MAINSRHLYDLVIMPSLNELAEVNPLMGARVAKKLVLFTICHESQCGYFLRQNGGNGGYLIGHGIAQVEPKTHAWIYEELTSKNGTLAKFKEAVFHDTRPALSDNRLIYDLSYAVKICRLRYWLAPARLPEDDIEAIANYWGKYYQTDDQDLKTLSAKERLFIAHAKQYATEFIS